MSKKAALQVTTVPDCHADERLKHVVTLQEACLLFGKSRTAIKSQVLRRNVAARRSITGGDWLISFEDLQKLYHVKREELVCLIG